MEIDIQFDYTVPFKDGSSQLPSNAEGVLRLVTPRAIALNPGARYENMMGKMKTITPEQGRNPSKYLFVFLSCLSCLKGAASLHSKLFSNIFEACTSIFWDIPMQISKQKSLITVNRPIHLSLMRKRISALPIPAFIC